MRLHRLTFVRALFAPAAVAAAMALAGCDTDGIAPSGRAQAPLSERMLATFKDKNMDKESPILVRIFKEEAELEVWKQNNEGRFALLKTYPICRWSGDLGPKIKEGDRQAPEGFYNITPGQMNPNSNYYLAFNTGYPNAFDRAHGRTGSELMVHGDCSSRGCYAMTDEQMVEIYALARESFFGGQKAFQLQAYPFRMTALNMAKHRNNPHYAFWKMLKVGYDHFEATKQQPKVDVCEKRYVFDAAAPENASRPINFSPKGKCPVYQIDPSIAQTVMDYRRNEETEIANYISRGVQTVAFRHDDGGSNPSFAFKLASMQMTNPRLTAEASGEQAPGYLPRTPNTSTKITSVETPIRSQPAIESQPEPQQPQETVVANVPMPRTAPQPKEGEAPVEQPTTIAGLIGTLFNVPKQDERPQPQQQQAASEPEEEQQRAERVVQRPQPAAKPKPEPKQPVQLAAKPKAEPKPKVEIAQTQSPWPQTPAQPAQAQSPWPQTPAAQPAKPQQVAQTPKPQVEKQQPQEQAVMRTASLPAETKPPKKKFMAANAAEAEPRQKPAEKRQPEKKAEPEQPTLRTAYSATTPTNGLMTGSQPVLATGAFR
jgi:murein L,D-transpeptidase YafK